MALDTKLERDGDGRRQVVVFVGGGPRTVGLVERLAASAAELAPGVPFDLHVVDPHPAGGGRIWRSDQSELLWMNSVAEDVTVFTDDSVDCEGPVVPGPSLAQWAAGPGRARLAARGWVPAGQVLPADAFAPRGVQSEYLAWAWDRAVSRLPPEVDVTTHAERAIVLADEGERQVVTLASGRQLHADVVVLAQGYLDQRLTEQEEQWRRAAEARGLTYIPPGYTADLDLSGLKAGEPVAVRGMGLAFVDLMVMLGEGRGGTFERTSRGRLTYRPSGREPILYAGSRRGVPYHAKLGYSNHTGGPVALRWFTPQRLESIAGGGLLDFRTQVWPLVALELTGAHYTRLFDAHPERTRGRWSELAALLETADLLAPDESLVAEVSRFVPDPADQFWVHAVDRPLAGVDVSGARADAPAITEEAVVAHIEGDLARRADPRHSADRAVFDTLLSVYGVLAHVVAQGRLGPEDRVRQVEEVFHGFFSFLASGPPPQRLEELLAMHRAGVVHFLGPSTTVRLTHRGFEATSATLSVPVHSRAVVDARLPRTDITSTADPLVRGLLRRGAVTTEQIVADDGQRVRGGQLLADTRCRAIRVDRSVHPRLFLLGPSVSGSAGAAGFSRPGFNGAGLRQNDAVARHLLTILAGAAIGTSTTRKDEHRHAS